MKILALFFVSLVAAALGRSAEASHRDLPRSTPEAQGLRSTALINFIDAAESKITALHSFMLVRRGHIVAEGWWAPYAADLPHQMFSLSKSFTSTAVGLAIADGKFRADDLVASFFPGETPEKPSANLRAMRVRDLLTMATGHHNEDLQNFPYDSEESVVRKFLALPVTHKPGTFFVYNTPASYMLSAIVQKTTGQTVLEYLRPRLFEPLGIANPAWEASKQGVSLGGFGLSVRTEDIARFGQLYLQRGQWHGRQLLPVGWVDTATTRWMSNGSNPASDWEQGYGYQFWRCRYGVFRGDGAHGQFCVVFPELDAVVAITAGTRDLQGVLNLIWEQLLPALQLKAPALPEDPVGSRKLTERLSHLTLRTPAAGGVPSEAGHADGRRYVFPQNPQRVDSVALVPSTSGANGMDVTLKIGNEEHMVSVSRGQWKKGQWGRGGTAEPIAASGAWTQSATFTFEVVRTHTPFSTRYTLRFRDNEVMLTIEPNLGPASATPVKLVGQRS